MHNCKIWDLKVKMGAVNYFLWKLSALTKHLIFKYIFAVSLKTGVVHPKYVSKGVQSHFRFVVGSSQVSY